MPATVARSRRLPGLAVMLALLVNLGPAGMPGPVRADDGVAVIRLTPNGPASYAVVVSANPKSAWAVWAVTGKNR